MPGLGTLVNVVTVLAGTAAGLLVGRHVPDRVRLTCLQAVGLVTFAIGVSEVIRTRNVVFPLVAVVAGTGIGEALRIEDRLESLGERLRERFSNEEDADAGNFVEGFVAASLLFCVGPLAILGAIRDGVRHEIDLLLVKSALDGFASLIFAAALGWGVGFSAVSVLVYQGAITVAALAAQDVFTNRMIVEMTATGGVMVMGIALWLLDLKKVRVASMLPGLLIAPVLVAAFAR
jgi:uncharacterized membrane protein YqgA involved in biofilm formation